MCEPLKGKKKRGLIIMTSDGMQHHPTTAPTKIKDEWFHKDDVKSAVEGFEEEISDKTNHGMLFRSDVDELIKKWFKDVIE